MFDTPEASRHGAGEILLSMAALVFLAAWAWPIVDPDPAPVVQRVCQAVMAATWVAFALVYLVRLARARDRARFLRAHLVELVVLVVPALHPLRFLWLIGVVRALNRGALASLRGHVAAYVTAVTAFALVGGALIALRFERDAPGGNITTFGNALWWAATTITTTGYGDFYPVTVPGRLAACGLYVAGIALIGVASGTLASWFVEKIQPVDTAPSRGGTTGTDGGA